MTFEPLSLFFFFRGGVTYGRPLALLSLRARLYPKHTRALSCAFQVFYAGVYTAPGGKHKLETEHLHLLRRLPSTQLLCGAWTRAEASESWLSSQEVLFLAALRKHWKRDPEKKIRAEKETSPRLSLSTVNKLTCTIVHFPHPHPYPLPPPTFLCVHMCVFMEMDTTTDKHSPV